MNMIEALRVALSVYEQYGNKKVLLIRPKHYERHRFFARTWYVIEPFQKSHVLKEAFWHPDDCLLKTSTTELPNVDAMTAEWEVRSFDFQSIHRVLPESMDDMKEMFYKGKDLPSFEPVLTSPLQTS